jgi:hypothetical protein
MIDDVTLLAHAQRLGWQEMVKLLQRAAAN